MHYEGLATKFGRSCFVKNLGLMMDDLEGKYYSAIQAETSESHSTVIQYDKRADRYVLHPRLFRQLLLLVSRNTTDKRLFSLESHMYSSQA